MSEIVGVKLQINGEEKIVKSVGELRKLLKEAQFEALALSSEFGETSKEAAAAAKRVALLKDSIADTNERIGLFDPGQKFKVLGNAVQTAAGGLAALQGAMGLLGSESEDVQKSLLKVQSALALSQGLSAISDGAKDFQRLGAEIARSTVFLKANDVVTKIATATQRLFGISVDATSMSFKVLKGAIAATGIGLLVVLLGEAVSAFQNYTSAAEDAAKAQENFNKKTVEYADAQLKGELETLDRTQKLLASAAKARGASEAEIFEIEQSGRRLRLASLNRYYEQVKGADKAKEEDTLKQIKDAEADITVAQNEERGRRRVKKEKDDEDAFIAEQEALKKKLDAEYQLELDAYNKRVTLRGKESQELIDASLTLTEKRLEQKKKDEEQAKIDAELLEAMQNSVLGKSIENQIAANATKLANDKATSDAAIVIAQKEAEAKMASFQATATALTNLSLIAGRETAAGKALAIAASLINTYAAIAGQLKAFAGVPIPGYAIANAIATGIAGFAAVKQIVAVQVPGGGGGGINGSVPSLSAGSPLNPTTIAANQVTLDQRSINAIGNKAIRAYVVESEISSAQQKIRRIQRQTTFG